MVLSLDLSSYVLDRRLPSALLSTSGVVITMYPWYYYYYPYYPMPYDPFTLMNVLMQWTIWPYYYAMFFETYKAMIDTWRKALEGLSKAFEKA